MKFSQITSLSGFQRILENTSVHMWRGVPNIKYKLIPKVARDWHLPDDCLKFAEKHLLTNFKIRATPFLSTLPNNEWEWLALAQHYGLPTRLLDWTRNPLVALYFACTCNNNHKKDGAVYFAECINEVDINKIRNPFEINERRKWSANHINNRLAAQDALFTVSDNPLINFDHGVVACVRVKSFSKEKIIKTLSGFGVHPGNLFPGLDGVAKYVESEFFELKGFSDKEALIKAMEKLLENRNG